VPRRPPPLLLLLFAAAAAAAVVVLAVGCKHVTVACVGNGLYVPATLLLLLLLLPVHLGHPLLSWPTGGWCGLPVLISQVRECGGSQEPPEYACVALTSMVAVHMSIKPPSISLLLLLSSHS
jgi:hypothetical protein